MPYANIVLKCYSFYKIYDKRDDFDTVDFPFLHGGVRCHPYHYYSV